MIKSNRNAAVKIALIGVFFALIMVGLRPLGAFAEDLSDDLSTNDLDQSLEAEHAGKANSWRYTDGVLDVGDSLGGIETQTYQEEKSIITPFATVEGAWRKNSDGYYISSDGSIIANAVAKGIDVWEGNGRIDWEAARADGIDFAIIRCGYGMDYEYQDDGWWEYNVSECERLGIPYGVYLYSYADSVARASSEADHVLRLVRGHNPTYPIYYDLEETSLESTSNRDLLAAIATTFCDKITDAGYSAGVYANLNWWNNYLTSSVFDRWDRWVAQWNTRCTYTGNYTLWQCAGDAYNAVNGVNGAVDINFRMSSYPADVDPADWYVVSGAYAYVTQTGLMQGYGTGLFGPYDSITRGQAATVLWRLAGEPIIDNAAWFEDVNYNEYYGRAIAWARSTGVINGYLDNDGVYRRFGPNDAVTREQLAVMMANFARAIRGLNTESNCIAMDAKVDAAQVSSWARTSMGWAVDKGLINGIDRNGVVWLDPQSSAWRASAASMMYVLCIQVL